jgi:hypothetical protein
MEEPPPMSQLTMTALTCTTIPASMLTMTLTPSDDMTLNPTPMLHQATPENPEEFADEGTEENAHPNSEKDPGNEKNTDRENRTNREAEQTKLMESTTLDNVVVDDDVNIKVGKKESDTTHLISIKGCSAKKLSITGLRNFCRVHSIRYKSLSKTGLF